MAGGGEAGHVQPDLGDHRGRGDGPETGDLIDALHGVDEWDDHLLDRGVEFGDVGGEGVDAGEHLGQQEPNVVGEESGEGLLQLADLDPQPAPSPAHRAAAVPAPRRRGTGPGLRTARRAGTGRAVRRALIEGQRRRFFAVSVDLVAAERLHVDGGVLDNLPVGEMAAEREGPVLGVDIAQPFGPAGLPPIADTIGRSMMIASGRLDDPARSLAHTVLTPRLDGFGLFDFGRLDELVDRGREAARAAVPQLRDQLSR